MKKNNKKLPIVLLSVPFIIGLIVMCYPIISSRISAMNQASIIKEYKKTSLYNSEEENKKILEPAKRYNKLLKPTTITDIFTNPKEKVSEDYQNILNINGTGVMGYISIPKIGEKIPIYHGTSEKVLQKGVGHLEGSSFPIGGKSTHAILSAHRGLPSARLFTDLNQLEEGDKFYIYILDKLLTYEVDKIKVTEPDETEALKLQDGYDYITLVTCTPYAINTHRLLVRGIRVSNGEEKLEKGIVKKGISTANIIFIVGLAMALFTISIFIFLMKRWQEESMYIRDDGYYDPNNESEEITKEETIELISKEDIPNENEEIIGEDIVEKNEEKIIGEEFIEKQENDEEIEEEII